MVVYRLVVVATLHVICGMLTGANLAQRDYIKTGDKSGKTMLLWVAVPAILLHGSYDLLVNLLHAEEIHSRMHHPGVLWCIGGIALAAGICGCSVIAKQLRDELRGSSIRTRRNKAGTLMRATGKVLLATPSFSGRKSTKLSAHIV